MRPSFSRRRFLLSATLLAGAGALGGSRLILPRPASAGQFGSVPTEEFCQSVALFTEPQTRTLSAYVIDPAMRTVSPDTVLFRGPGGVLSFLDGTGLLYATAANEVRMAGGFIIVNGEPFSMDNPHHVARATALAARLMGKDPDLLSTPTMMGAGALLGYFQVVRDSGLQPAGGLTMQDLADAASVAQLSLDFLRARPAAEEVGNKAFQRRSAEWDAAVAERAAVVQKDILKKFKECVDAAANDLALKKCQLLHEARQKCLDNAVNQCKGMCKAVAEADDAATTKKAIEACEKLLRACAE